MDTSPGTAWRLGEEGSDLVLIPSLASNGSSTQEDGIRRSPPTSWPKEVPELTPEQQRIQDDWMRHWLGILPDRYRRVERFNHGYPLRGAPPRGRTLEIGAGRGGHIQHENLSVQDYHAVELRPELVKELRARFPTVHAIQADCQRSLPFDDAYFDRVLAIHILEHLPDLPSALEEVRRVLKPTGRFLVCIPCERGLAHRLGRRLTVQRTFERRYGVPYGPHIRADHVNEPREIIHELGARFRIAHRRFFPLAIPLVDLNIQIGLTLEHRLDR